MRKGQVAIEYLIVVGMLLAVIGVAFIYSFTILQNTADISKTQKSVSAIKDAADLAYSRGPGTKIYVDIDIPASVSEASLAGNTVKYTLSLGSQTTDVWETAGTEIVGNLPDTPGMHTMLIEMKDDGTLRIGESTSGGYAATMIVSPSSVYKVVETDVDTEIDFNVGNYSGQGLTGISAQITGSIAAYTTIAGVETELDNGALDAFTVNVDITEDVGTYNGVLEIRSNEGISDRALITATINQELDTNLLYITTYSDSEYSVIANAFYQGEVVYYQVLAGEATVSDLNVTISDPYNQSLTRENQVAINGIHYGSYLLQDNANTGIWNLSAITNESGYAEGSTSFTVVASGGIDGDDEGEGEGGEGGTIVGYSSGNDVWLISKYADFSTVDTNFNIYDTLYAKVITDNFGSNPVPSDPGDDPDELSIVLNNGSDSLSGHISGTGDANTYTGMLVFNDADWNNLTATVEVSIEEYEDAFYGAQEIRIGNPIDAVNFYSDNGYTNNINYDVYPGQTVYLEIITNELDDRAVTQNGSNRYIIEGIDSGGTATSQGEMNEEIDRTAENTYRGQFTVPDYYEVPDWYVLHVFMRSTSGWYEYDMRKSFHISQNSGSQYQNFSFSPSQLNYDELLEMDFEYKSTNNGVATHYAVALSEDTIADAQDYWIVGIADAQLHNLSAGIDGGITNGVWAAENISQEITSEVPFGYYYVILVTGDSSVSTPGNWDNYSRLTSRVRVGENMAPEIRNIASVPLNPSASENVTVSAIADDSLRGGSNISYCNISVDEGAWSGMYASDTAFDSDTEAIESDLGLLSSGEHYYSIRCADSVNNIATSAAQSINVVTATGLLISEVFFSYGSSADEQWVELYNPTGDAISVSGYTLRDLNETYYLPAASVPSHRSMLFAADAGTFETEYGFGADYNSLSLVMNNQAGDYLILRDSLNADVDFVAFNSPSGYAEWDLNASAGKTVRRSPINGDSDLPGDWVSESVAQPVGIGG